MPLLPPRVCLFDLDGTISRRDTFVPYVIGLLLRRPWRLPRLVLAVPAVLARPDAAAVGQFADHTILVMRAARHTADEIRESVSRLAEHGVKVDAGVLNRVGEMLGSYGYKGYRINRYT